jgi:hypothetical protein
VREVELRAGTPSAVRALLSLAYKVKSYGDLLGLDAETMIGFALDHEEAKGWITPDLASSAA